MEEEPGRKTRKRKTGGGGGSGLKGTWFFEGTHHMGKENLGFDFDMGVGVI